MLIINIPSVVATLVKADLFHLDAWFVVENRFRDRRSEICNQALVELFENEIAQLATKIIVQEPLAQSGAQQDFQALLDVFDARDHFQVFSLAGKCRRPAPAGA